MQRRALRWLMLVGSGGVMLQAAGCGIDPDIVLRSALSFGSDAAIFLLENLFASL